MKIGILSSLAYNTGASLRGEYLADYLGREGHDVYYFKPHHPLKYKMEYVASIPYNMLRVFNKSFDFLIVLKPYPGGCLPAIMSCITKKTKVVIDIDDLDYTYRKGALAKLIKLMQEFLIPKSDIITVLDNDYLVDYLTKNLAVSLDKIIRLPQGVDTDMFNPSRYNGKNIRRQLKLENVKVFVFTGHLIGTAELDSVLYAFRGVVKERPNTRLIIVGGGSHLKNYMQLVRKLKIEDSIMFTGYLEDVGDIPNYTSLADACVCYHGDKPSNYYRASMKVREYLSMGKKVVCTDVGDLKSFKNYTIQTKPTVECFTEGMLQALDGGENSNGEGAKRREFISNNYSWDKIAEKLSDKLEMRI